MSDKLELCSMFRKEINNCLDIGQEMNIVDGRDRAAIFASSFIINNETFVQMFIKESLSLKDLVEKEDVSYVYWDKVNEKDYHFLINNIDVVFGKFEALKERVDRIKSAILADYDGHLHYIQRLSDIVKNMIKISIEYIHVMREHDGSQYTKDFIPLMSVKKCRENYLMK